MTAGGDDRGASAFPLVAALGVPTLFFRLAWVPSLFFPPRVGALTLFFRRAWVPSPRATNGQNSLDKALFLVYIIGEQMFNPRFGGRFLARNLNECSKPMRIEEIHERVEVIALFRNGSLLPLKFRWKGREYRVLRMNCTWNTDEGETRFHHFAVMSDGPDVYELTYNRSTYEWKIENVSLIG